VNGGTLKLLAKRENVTWLGQNREYTSGMIHSKNSFKFFYGKFEMRGKIPYGMGFWPAFWFFGDGANEIDVFEFGCQSPTTISTNVHKTTNNQHYFWSEDYVSSSVNPIDYSEAFHIYSLEWEPNQIIFKVDGNTIRKMPRYWSMLSTELFCTNYIAPGAYVENLLMPDNPLNIILNLAIGVNGVTPFTGSPNSSTILPNQFEIDYVRIYQRNPQSGFNDLCSGRNISGSSIICAGQQKTYAFNGNFLNLRWTVSPNLMVDNTANNTIIVHPSIPIINGTAWICASDDMPCSQNSFYLYLTVGSPTPGPITIDFDAPPRRFTASIDDVTTATAYKWYLDGQLKYTTPNTSVIFQRQLNNCGHVYYVDVTEVNACGVSEISHAEVSEDPCYSGFSIHPNPASENITLTTDTAKNTVATSSLNAADATTLRSKFISTNSYIIRVLDSFGALKTMLNKSGESATLSTGNLNNGVYIIEINDGKNLYRQQLVVKH